MSTDSQQASPQVNVRLPEMVMAKSPETRTTHTSNTPTSSRISAESHSRVRLATVNIMKKFVIKYISHCYITS